MRAKYYNDDARRNPEEITDILGAIIERAGTGADRKAGTLVEAWDDIVPERWRDLSRPVGIRRQVLLVEVPSGAEASVLRHDTAVLLSAISQRFGSTLVTDVKLRVSRSQKPHETP
jgi:hypothetical protein